MSVSRLSNWNFIFDLDLRSGSDAAEQISQTDPENQFQIVSNIAVELDSLCSLLNMEHIWLIMNQYGLKTKLIPLHTKSFSDDSYDPH